MFYNQAYYPSNKQSQASQDLIDKHRKPIKLISNDNRSNYFSIKSNLSSKASTRNSKNDEMTELTIIDTEQPRSS